MLYYLLTYLPHGVGAVLPFSSTLFAIFCNFNETTKITSTMLCYSKKSLWYLPNIHDSPSDKLLPLRVYNKTILQLSTYVSLIPLFLLWMNGLMGTYKYNLSLLFTQIIKLLKKLLPNYYLKYGKVWKKENVCNLPYYLYYLINKVMNFTPSNVLYRIFLWISHKSRFYL